MKDFYYILGTEANCTSGELNAAYRKLAQKLQPAGQEQDYFLDSHFQEITEAYQILSNPTSRRKYDMALKKSYQRRLYYFKITHVNVAVTLTLILFTVLFGYYVVRSINGSKAKKIAAVAPVVTPRKIKHQRKKHFVKTAPIAINKPSPIKVDTPSAPIVKHIVAKVAEPASPVVVKHVPPKAVEPPVDPVVKSQSSLNDVAYIEANITGVVNLHNLASYTSAVLAAIPNHTKISVLEKGQTFYKISYNNQVGYVPKWTVHAQ